MIPQFLLTAEFKRVKIQLKGKVGKKMPVVVDLAETPHIGVNERENLFVISNFPPFTSGKFWNLSDVK
jgi:hypothetical protein